MIMKGRSSTRRHLSRTHRVALHWSFDRISLDPRSKSNMLTPKNNPRTCWPKEGLRVMNARLSNIMNFSITFRTESRVSCPRGLGKVRLKKVRQRRNRGRWIWCEGTSWAHRIPLRKIRVLRTLGVSKLMRNSNQDPTAHSPERRQDDPLSSSTRILGRSGEPSSSASTRKLVRGDDNQIERTRLAFHNLQISDQRYLEKVFKNLRQKLNLAEDAPVLDLKATLLIRWLFMSTTILSPRTILHWKFGRIQEYQLQRAHNFVRYHVEVDIGTWSRNSECIDDWLVSFLVDEIYAYARSSKQVDESKSTRLLRSTPRPANEDSAPECLAITVATPAAARHIGVFCFREHQGTGAKTGPKVHQQTTQNHGASGNRCEVLSHLLKKKSLNFKSSSE